MEVFKLPAVGYENLIKIIQAYDSVKKEVYSLNDIVNNSGLHKDTIIKNNHFLISTGIIGDDKIITELGKSLSRAYEFNIKYEIISIWTGIINNTEFLSSLINNLRISGKHFEFEEYKNKILHDSNDNNNTFTKSGSSCIIEIFKICNFIVINEGIISYNKKYIELNDMKDKIEQLNKLEEENNNNEDNTNDIKEKIYDLNKDIFNYGLSEKFYIKSMELKKEYVLNHIFFMVSILVDILVLITFFIINTKLHTDNLFFNIKLLVLSFGILGLLLWVTKYFNRRVHETIQLSEDYEHKSLVLSSFYIYSRELKKLDTSDKRILTDYVNKVSTTTNKNPAVNLNKRKPDNSPVEDIKDILLQLVSLANLKK